MYAEASAWCIASTREIMVIIMVVFYGTFNIACCCKLAKSFLIKVTAEAHSELPRLSLLSWTQPNTVRLQFPASLASYMSLCDCFLTVGCEWKASHLW